MSSAAFSTSGSNRYGKAYSARMACISVSFSPGSPSTSTICPRGFGAPLGHPSTIAATFMPDTAPFFATSSMETPISYGIVLLCISTHAWLPTTCSMPTKGLGDRDTISSTFPSFRILSVFSFVTATLTVSPFRAPIVLEALTNTSSSRSSTITKIYPSRVICTRPMYSGKTLVFFCFPKRDLPSFLPLRSFLSAI